MKTADNHDFINAVRAVLGKDPIPGTSIPNPDKRDRRFVEQAMHHAGTGNRRNHAGSTWVEEL